MRRLIIGLACAAVLGLHAQTAKAPGTLAGLRERARPLLVFAPGGEVGRFRAQVEALDGPGMRDRQMPLVPVLAAPNGYVASGSIPSAALSAGEQAAARNRFGVGVSEFRVLLLGKDGGEKFASGEPVAWDKLAELVDRMPMRREEMRSEQIQASSRLEELRREQAREDALQAGRKREQMQLDARQAERKREQTQADARQAERKREQARHK